MAEKARKDQKAPGKGSVSPSSGKDQGKKPEASKKGGDSKRK